MTHPLVGRRRLRVALLVVATGRYTEFVDPLLASARTHLLAGHDVDPIVFTDAAADAFDHDVTTIAVDHGAWPYPALRRYHRYRDAGDLLASFDHIVSVDADVRFVGTVGDEVLGDLVLTAHPYFYADPPDSFTYERRPESAAGVRFGDGTHYFAGAFVGGSPTRFLDLAARIAEGVDRDEAAGIVALWHDESHLNRVAIDAPPSKVLTPSYCYPDGWDLPFPAKVIALEKDHAALRD